MLGCDSYRIKAPSAIRPIYRTPAVRIMLKTATQQFRPVCRIFRTANRIFFAKLTDEDQTKKFSLNTIRCQLVPLHCFGPQRSEVYGEIRRKTVPGWNVTTLRIKLKNLFVVHLACRPHPCDSTTMFGLSAGRDFNSYST